LLYSLPKKETAGQKKSDTTTTKKVVDSARFYQACQQN